MASTSKRSVTAKLVLLGKQSVGKSSIVTRFVKDSFDEYKDSTIGAAFHSTTVELENTLVKFDIWDTAGQEKYQSLTPLYYQKAVAAVIVYDITDNSSLQRAQRWVEEMEGLSDGAPIMALTGNKCDLEERRQVNSGEVEAFAREHKLLFTETSAKTGRNVVEIFEQLAKKVSKLQPVMKDDNNFTLDDSLTERKKKSKCC